MTPIETVHSLVAPVCDAADVELVDIELEGGVLRVTVDRDGGLPVGALTKVTRQINRLLDEDDPIPGRYTLEVSTPGLERKLRTPAHFRRAVGETVSLRTSTRAAGGPERFEAVLVAADDDGVTLTRDGAEEPLVLRYDQIDKARTVFVFPAEAKSDKTRPTKKKAQR
jgi:ribosome maturation factor RimP